MRGTISDRGLSTFWLLLAYAAPVVLLYGVNSELIWNAEGITGKLGFVGMLCAFVFGYGSSIILLIWGNGGFRVAAIPPFLLYTLLIFVQFL